MGEERTASRQPSWVAGVVEDASRARDGKRGSVRKREGEIVVAEAERVSEKHKVYTVHDAIHTPGEMPRTVWRNS